MSKEKTKQTVQTTGHAWDGDLQEFNNPLPSWWLWAFYATVIFAVVYWVLYPTWPVGNSYTKGVANDITYTTTDGKQVTSHWNTRSLLMKDLADARAEQAQYLEQLKTASYNEIAKDEEKSAFAYSMAKVLFADNCAACHQAGGNGVIGPYPNLLDDAWLWGGTYANIEESIKNGRNGNMPGFKGQLSATQIENVAEYVLSLSGQEMDMTKAKQGEALFSTNCAVCHGQDAKGQIFMGSANLTDGIWTIANIPAAATPEAKKAAVTNLIVNGKSRQMPAWKDRLSDTEIKILTFYVHALGGGQ
jgi:cytochrome c oxidase cbb3-type subunit 3